MNLIMIHESMPGTSATVQDVVVLPFEVQLRHERSMNQMLTTKVHQLEQTNQKLTEKVHQLEQELQSIRQAASSIQLRPRLRMNSHPCSLKEVCFVVDQIVYTHG